MLAVRGAVPVREQVDDLGGAVEILQRDGRLGLGRREVLGVKSAMASTRAISGCLTR